MANSNFSKRGFTGFVILIIFLFAGSEIFQGYKVVRNPPLDNIFNYDESNPYIDRPTREALSHVVESDESDLDIITDATGFDNFEIGVDFAEQMLVSNPGNPANMQFGVNSQATGQAAYYTTDGHDWTLNNPNYHTSTCCDPWSAWDSLGGLHYGSGVNGQYVYNSSDGGQSYSAPILSVSGFDRNTMAADQTNGPFSNYIYAAISPGNFSRSTDRGATWTQTASVFNDLPGVMIAVGPNGSVQGGTVIFVTTTAEKLENGTYNFFRSNNGGAPGSFSLRSSLTVAGYVGTFNTVGRFVINNARTRPYPMIAMDNSYGPYRGRLYLVYASNVPAGNGNKPDIILQYSTDQGATWSGKITVNDNVNPHLSDQWFPAIWCVKETGRLYIKWYDTRENPGSYLVNVYATYTDNGGSSFATSQKLTTQSWTYPNPPCSPNTNCYRGDYDGCTANPKTSFNVWYDGRQGTYKNVGAYFPDFAMKVGPATITVLKTNGEVFYDVIVPDVKLYTDTVLFSASVFPAPLKGSIVTDFPDGNSLTTYPDTSRIRVRTFGGVTPDTYTITITGKGPNGTPVHKRTVRLIVRPVLPTTINIKLAIQGFYNVSADRLNISDTVRGYIRKTNAPYEIVDSAKAKVDSSTFTGGFVFFNIVSGQYYLHIKHRNSIETWNKSGGMEIHYGFSHTYDFTTSASQAFGDNMTLKGTKYCIYNGDADQDGVVDGTDLGKIDNDAAAFALGYLRTDVNGDYVIDGTDLIIADNNAANFIQKIIP